MQIFFSGRAGGAFGRCLYSEESLHDVSSPIEKLLLAVPDPMRNGKLTVSKGSISTVKIEELEQSLGATPDASRRTIRGTHW